MGTRGKGARLAAVALAALSGCGYFSDDPAEESTDSTLSPEAAAVNECFTRSADWVDLLTADTNAVSTLAYAMGTRHPMYVVITRANTMRLDTAYRDGAEAANEAAVAYLRERCQTLYGEGSTTPTVPPPP